VLVSPVLSFQATVNNPAQAVLYNTAILAETGGVIGAAPSNRTQTTTGAAVGDRVWIDLDGDGTDNGGLEPGLQGVTINVTGPTCAPCTAVTDANGNYIIGGLTAGAYTVTYNQSTIPTGYLPTTTASLNRTLTSGEQWLAADFGLRPPGPGAIGDTIWLDADEDGIVDTGEGGLPKIGVTLYKDRTGNGLSADDLLVATTTTNATGHYTFTGLYAGNYLVQINTNSVVTTTRGVTSTLGAAMDLVSTAGLTTPLSNPYAVTLATDNTIITNTDFGYNWRASIGDYLWYDSDGDTVQNSAGDEGGAVTTVVLYYDSNGNGRIDPGEPIVNIVDSAPGTGLYLFDNLPPGNYVVKAEEQQVPAPPSSPNAGQNGTMVSTTGTEDAVSLAAGQHYRNADFGFIEAAEVEGHLFHDIDSSGTKDGGESGLAQITVTLSGTDINGNPVNRNTTTDSSGGYSFIVPPGAYTISYNTADPDIPPALTTATTPTSLFVTVSGGQERSGLDFGRDHSGAIGDLLFIDTNGNGLHGSGETGLANVTVQLYDSSNNLLTTQSTDSSGAYLFPGLADGVYTVRVVTSTLPVNYSQTADPEFNNDNAGSAIVIGGSSVLTMDFGYQPQTVTHQITGTVYHDLLNGNGSLDVGEPGLPAVKVRVTYTPTSGAPTTVVVTVDSSGAYTVTGIPDGSHVRIKVDTTTLPHSAFVPTSANPLLISGISSGRSNLDVGFKEQFGSIGGTVVIGDGDGRAEAGESPIQGITITLRYAGPDGFLNTSDDITATTTTDANGTYLFTGLLPGLYQIVQTNLPEYLSLADRDGGNPDNISVMLAIGENRSQQDFEDQPPTADITVVKYDDPDPVIAGTIITYTIIITNHGPSIAHNVIITDTLATGTSLLSAPAGCSVVFTQVVCNLVTMAVGESKQVTLTVTVEP
jgi:large repetitive protein